MMYSRRIFSDIKGAYLDGEDIPYADLDLRMPFVPDCDSIQFRQALICIIEKIPLVDLRKKNCCEAFKYCRMTRLLNISDGAEVAFLRDSIRTAAETYLEKFKQYPIMNNYLSPLRNRCSIRLSAAVIGTGGYMGGHIHDLGLLSGSYYLQLGRKCVGGELELWGEAFSDVGETLKVGEIWHRLRCPVITPEVGAAHIMPSFIPHRVRSYYGIGERISVNFDVSPA